MSSTTILCIPPDSLEKCCAVSKRPSMTEKCTRIKIIILHCLSAKNSTFTDTCILVFSSCCKEESEMMINFVN